MFYALTARCARNNSRSTTDAEFFRANPSAPWRLTVRQFNRDYFTFKITTRDGTRVSEGDRWDWLGKFALAGGGSPLERIQRAVHFLLADPNRTYCVRAA